MSAKSKWQAAATAAAATTTMTSRMKSRKAQRGVPLNLMVVGQSGLGKSTFVRTLVGKELIPKREFDQFNDLTERTVDINTYTEDIEADGQKIILTVIDTPGFGDNIDNSKSYLRILEYTEAQHKRFLAEETRVQRNAKFQDTRIHVIVYFIPPTGHCLRDVDIVFMKHLGKRANIIPIIAKSDSLLPSELKDFKKRIMEDVEKFEIPIFDFHAENEEDEEIIQENKEFRAMLPFSVVASDDYQEVNGEQVPVRRYPWGTVVASDEKLCEFSTLKLVLLVSHLETLKEQTNDHHYEQYREEALTKAGGTLESKTIEDELKTFEQAESEFKEKAKAERERRISLKMEKSKRVPKKEKLEHGREPSLKEEDNTSEDGRKKSKTSKTKKSTTSLLEDEDEGAKKEKKKKKEKREDE